MNMAIPVTRDIGIHSVVPQTVFSEKKMLPAVNVLVCQNNKILLTRPHAAPRNLGWWILPQKSLDSNDQTLVWALARELYVDIGIVLSQSEIDSAQLLRVYQNPLPLERSKHPGVFAKYIFVVGIHLDDSQSIKSPRVDYQWASSWGEIDQLMADVAERRVRKYMATCDCIRIASMKGLLSWGIPGEQLLH